MKLSKRFVFILFALLITIVGIYFSIKNFWLCDDAFISFIYAKNYFAGYGLVYNPGEYVEGFTHPLWLGLLILFKYFGQDFESSSVMLGLFSMIFLLALLFISAYKDFIRERLVFPFAAFLCVLNYDFIVWSSGGLETMFFTFLAFSIFYCLVFLKDEKKNNKVALIGILSGLLVLTRPDGVVFVLALSFLYLIISLSLNKTKLEIVKNIIIIIGGVLAINIPYLIFRLFYYGDIFPNTYYAKDGNKIDFSYMLRYGAVYVYYYFYVYFSSLAIIVAGIYYAAKKYKHTKNLKLFIADDVNFKVFAALTFIFFYLALFVIRYGGDFMFARFIIPVAPFIYFIAERLIYSINIKSSFQYAIGFLLALFVFLESYYLRKNFFEPDSENLKNIFFIGSVSADRNLKMIDFVCDEKNFYATIGEFSNTKINEPGFSFIELHKISGLANKSLFENENFYIALFGSQNSFAYYADIKYKIEPFGLTDKNISKSKAISERPGHKKFPTLGYLFEKRTLFSTYENYYLLFFETNDKPSIERILKYIEIGRATYEQKHGDLNVKTDYFILSYQKQELERLKQKTNGKFTYVDFEERMKKYIKEELPTLSLRHAAIDYEFFKKYYFMWNKNDSLETLLVNEIRKLK